MEIGTTITLIYVIIALVCFISYISIEWNEQKLGYCDTQSSISSWALTSVIIAIVLYGSINPIVLASAPEEVAPVFVIACLSLSFSSSFVYCA